MTDTAVPFFLIFTPIDAQARDQAYWQDSLQAVSLHQRLEDRWDREVREDTQPAQLAEQGQQEREQEQITLFLATLVQGMVRAIRIQDQVISTSQTSLLWARVLEQEDWEERVRHQQA